MRGCIALLAFVGWIASSSVMAVDAAEPVNPFTQPEPMNRGVSANVSDDSDGEEKPGFALPKLALPKLPTPSLPKMTMPKLHMPHWTMRETSPNPGPSTWQKLNHGTKSMFTKTRDTLMPWAAKDEKPPVRSVTGSRSSTGISRSRSGSNRGSSDSPSEKKSFFSSWLSSPEPEPNRVRTTNDFLSQDRPQFD